MCIYQSREFEFYCPALLPRSTEQQRPKIRQTAEANQLPIALDWESDSSIDISDEDVVHQGGGAEIESATPVGRWTLQAVHKVSESKALELEKQKRKRAAAKPKAPSVAAASLAKTSSRMLSDDSASPSPAAKKRKADLLETTIGDVEKLMERLKTEIRMGKLKEMAVLPLAPLRPKFRVKKSTM